MTLNPQLPHNLVIPLQHRLPPLLAPDLDTDLIRIRLQNHVAVSRLRVDGHLLARARADLGAEVERPQRGGRKDKGLVVDNVLPQAGAPAPPERVHRRALAEVGVAGERRLEGWPGRVEPPLRAEVVAVGVAGGDAVESPGREPGLVSSFLFVVEESGSVRLTIHRRE